MDYDDRVKCVRDEQVVSMCDDTQLHRGIVTEDVGDVPTVHVYVHEDELHLLQKP